MKHRVWTVAAGLLLIGSTTSGEPCTPDPGDPFAEGCQEWKAFQTSYDVLVYTNFAEVTVSPWIKGGWRGSTAFDCRYARCDQINNDPGPVDVTVERTTSVCWSVGGGVTAEIKKGFLAKLFQKLGVTVSIELTGNYQSCVTRSESFAGHVPSSQCVNNFGRVIYKNASTNGKEIYAETKTWFRADCSDENGDFQVERSRDCGRTTVSGEADKLAEEIFQIAPPPIACGGPDPADPLFDGKTWTKCCSPLPGCDENAQPPCCACWANP